MLPRLPGRAPLGLKQASQTNGTHQPTDHHKQQQQQVADLAVRVLLSTNSSSTYAKGLLRPLHTVSYAGREAALRTIKHLKLVRCKEEVPYSRQLSVLAAATSATDLTIRADQIAGLLEAWEQQQLVRDLAALQATLNHILDMEGGLSLAGAPYVAASSSSNTAATTSTKNSSSWGSTVASLISPIPAPAGKPHPGPHLERILVVGVLNSTNVQQLVVLLDALPFSQHLQHLVLTDYPISDNGLRWGDATIQPWAPWRQDYMHDACNDDYEEHAYRWLHDHSSSGSSSGRNSSGSGGGSSPCAGGGRDCGRSDSSCSSSDCMRTMRGVAPSSWRSSCHVVQWCSGLAQLAPHLRTLQPLLNALQQLWGLYLPGPHLGSLPKCAASLQHLQALDLHQVKGFRMKGVMEAVAGLTNLRSLGITTCSFSHIPAAFTALVRLTHLDLTDTTVTSEGLECLGDITGLREVQLSNCFHLERLPGSFAKLTGLETLTLGRTAFSALPEFFTALPQLRKLSWSSAGFRAAPPMYLESVWCLTGLQQLVFEESTIASLPPGISRLTGLTGLLVQAERLMEPPTTLSALVGLERLGIYAPRLVALPEAITALTKLTRIELLCDPREPLSPDVAAFVQPRRWSPSEDDA